MKSAIQALADNGRISYFIDSMKIKQTIIAFALMVGVGLVGLVPIAQAETCAGVDTSIIKCEPTPSSTNDVTQTGVWALLIIAINILTAGIGIAAVAGIVYASIIYATAGGSMDQTKTAKTMIYNIAVGLIAYALMYSFLNFLIPGGVFN